MSDLVGYTLDFGAFLASANPNLPKSAVAELVKHHVLTLKDVIDAPATKDPVKAYTALRAAARQDAGVGGGAPASSSALNRYEDVPTVQPQRRDFWNQRADPNRRRLSRRGTQADSIEAARATLSSDVGLPGQYRRTSERSTRDRIPSTTTAPTRTSSTQPTSGTRSGMTSSGLSR